MKNKRNESASVETKVVTFIFISVFLVTLVVIGFQLGLCLFEILNPRMIVVALCDSLELIHLLVFLLPVAAMYVIYQSSRNS